MTTIQLVQSKKLKVQNVRARLQSMRNLGKADQDSLLALQKSLQKHNKIDDPQIRLEQFENEDDVIIEDKLWHYFKNKAQQYNDKVERQKVNGWYKIAKTILQQTQKKIQINQNNIQHMQVMIKSKYKEIHELYKQIENIKIQKALQKQKGSRKKRTNVQTSRGQKIDIIYQNIQSLKQEIQQRNEQNQKIKVQLKKLKDERISFLVNAVKSGYYFQNGITFFLQNMYKIGYKPNINIFPDFLDARSKQFLLSQYEDIVTKSQNNKKQTQRGSSSKIRVKSHAQLGDLAKQQHFKDIYQGTKDYLHKLLLKQQWKKQQTKLPKIGFKNNNGQAQRRKQGERKRIKLAYTQQIRQKVKKIQFGVKLDTILN